MRAIHPDLIPYQRGYNTAKDFIEALVIERSAAGAQLAHIRDTKAQWAEADGGAAAVDAIFTRFEDGSLRLKDTTNTLFTRTSHPNNVTDLNRLSPLEACFVEWRGAEPTDLEILRIKLWLNPKVSGSQNRDVRRWRLELYAMVDYYLDRFGAVFDGTYAPLCEPLDVEVTTESAGEVTFDYSARANRPRPKSVTPMLGFNPLTLADGGRPPTTLLVVYALTENGESASNVAMGVNDAETSFTSGGQTLQRRRMEQYAADSPAGVWREDFVPRGVPHLVIENGTYAASETITFSSGNLFDLSAAPVGDVELVGLTQTPPGTSVTLEVRNDADSGWVAFTHGQFEEAGLLLTSGQSRKVRATLASNAAGNLTPALKKLGRQAIARIDFSRVATIEGYEQAFSPETHKVEIPRPRLVAVKDGPKTGPAAFSSKIEKLMAENFINDIRFRWLVGTAALDRAKWVHMDDFLVLDSRPRQPVIELQLVGLCALLKDLAPPFSPGTNYAPDGTQSIGTWTDLAGGTTNIHLAIDEPVADDSDGIRSVTSPANTEIVFTLPTPTDIAGRRLFLDCDYAKDQSGGEQIDLKIRVYQTAVLVVELTKTDIGPARVQSTLELSELQIGQLTDLPNVRIAFSANAPTPGTGRRAHVYWARFRSGGRREVVTYSGQTLKAVYDDLVTNRLAIPANLRGPGIENTTDTVSKQITGLRKRSPGSKDVVAKTEIEAIAFIADRLIGSGEGKIKAFDLSPAQPIRAVFRSRRITIGEASPGHERRIPEYFGGYRWDATKEEFKDEVRAFHSDSILKIGTLGLGPPKWWDEEIGKWIDTDAIAERVAKRVVDRLGTGEMLWSVDSADRYAELEVGDVVAVETDLFCSRDPNLDQQVKGRRYAVGPLQRVGSGWFFTVHPRGYADILSSAQLASRIGFAPPGEAIVGFARFTPMQADDPWNLSALFWATPTSLGSDHENFAHLSPTELPDGVTIRAMATRYLLGDAAGGGGLIVSGLWRVGNDGTGHTQLAGFSDGSVTDWTTNEQGCDHVVDWSQNHYYFWTILRSLGTVGNARFMWNRVTYGVPLPVEVSPPAPPTSPPTFQAAGSAASGTGTVAPAWPAHAVGDIALLFVESANEAISLSDAQGFVQVADSPQGIAGDNGTDTRLAIFWCRATSAAMVAPTVADPGDHGIAQILTFRGCIATGDPWDVTAGSTLGASNTTVNLVGDTTTVANCLVVAAASNGIDSALPRGNDDFVNTNLAAVTLRANVNTSSGNGGGFLVVTGIKITAGAFGTTTGTLVAASSQGRITIALKP